jgi:anti-sigma B factor antagonist
MQEDPMELSTAISRMNGTIVVHVSGAIHFGEESASLRILAKDLLKKSKQFVFDLGNVTHIDSGGVGALVAVYTSVRTAGGTIKFANLGEHTIDVLKVTKLVRVFEIYGKTKDAVASFHS